MTNHDTYQLAEVVVAALRPSCERIEIVGSLRRGRPEVNDIDLVLLPAPGQIPAIKDRIRRRCRVVTDGPDTVMAEMSLPQSWRSRLGQESVHLDVWFASQDERDLLYTIPSNWGTLLVCRTGSKEHNIRLAERAKALGLHWNPHKGVMRGESILAARTEEEIFRTLQIPLIPPAFREAHTNWAQFGESQPQEPPKKVSNPVSDADAKRMFDRMRAICAGRGTELQHRMMIRREK